MVAKPGQILGEREPTEPKGGEKGHAGRRLRGAGVEQAEEGRAGDVEREEVFPPTRGFSEELKEPQPPCLCSRGLFQELKGLKGEEARHPNSQNSLEELKEQGFEGEVEREIDSKKLFEELGGREFDEEVRERCGRVVGRRGVRGGRHEARNGGARQEEGEKGRTAGTTTIEASTARSTRRMVRSTRNTTRRASTARA